MPATPTSTSLHAADGFPPHGTGAHRQREAYTRGGPIPVIRTQA